MWTYTISTGVIAENGILRGTGYSGRAEGRDNPAMAHVKARGPLPPGKYRFGAAYAHPRLGPVCMNLEPLPGTEVFGRSLFRIHGDNATNDASHGCLVTGPGVRRAMAASRDRVLEVKA
jgi:hypothetical protein